jgi:hypothetical protein
MHEVLKPEMRNYSNFTFTELGAAPGWGVLTVSHAWPNVDICYSIYDGVGALEPEDACLAKGRRIANWDIESSDEIPDDAFPTSTGLLLLDLGKEIPTHVFEQRLVNLISKVPSGWTVITKHRVLDPTTLLWTALVNQRHLTYRRISHTRAISTEYYVTWHISYPCRSKDMLMSQYGNVKAFADALAYNVIRSMNAFGSYALQVPVSSQRSTELLERSKNSSKFASLPSASFYVPTADEASIAAFHITHIESSNTFYVENDVSGLVISALISEFKYVHAYFSSMEDRASAILNVASLEPMKMGHVYFHRNRHEWFNLRPWVVVGKPLQTDGPDFIIGLKEGMYLISDVDTHTRYSLRRKSLGDAYLYYDTSAHLCVSDSVFDMETFEWQEVRRRGASYSRLMREWSTCYGHDLLCEQEIEMLDSLYYDYCFGTPQISHLSGFIDITVSGSVKYVLELLASQKIVLVVLPPNIPLPLGDGRFITWREMMTCGQLILYRNCWKNVSNQKRAKLVTLRGKEVVQHRELMMSDGTLEHVVYKNAPAPNERSYTWSTEFSTK